MRGESNEYPQHGVQFIRTAIYIDYLRGWLGKAKVSCILRYFPVSILYKSITGRYRPVRVADGPITARYRFIKNASWAGRPTDIGLQLGKPAILEAGKGRGG